MHAYTNTRLQYKTITLKQTHIHTRHKIVTQILTFKHAHIYAYNYTQAYNTCVLIFSFLKTRKPIHQSAH